MPFPSEPTAAKFAMSPPPVNTGPPHKPPAAAGFHSYVLTFVTRPPEPAAVNPKVPVHGPTEAPVVFVLVSGIMRRPPAEQPNAFTAAVTLMTLPTGARAG